MLWLAAAFGLAVWEARRKRTLEARTKPSSSSHRHKLPFWGTKPLDLKSGSSSTRPNVAGRTFAELKQELYILSPENISADHEALEEAQRNSERVLPELCNLLQGSNDVETLVDVTELLALLSPSRRGLQSAICDAGAVPPLLALLASAADLLRQQPPAAWATATAPDHVHSAEPTQSADPRLPPHRSAGAGAALSLLDGQERRPFSTRRSDSRGADNREAGSRGGSSDGGGGGDGGGSSDGSDDSGAAYPIVLAYTLRTLVNLTSNARGGAGVRQAILRDDAALEALLGLLHVPEELEEDCDGEGTAVHGGTNNNISWRTTGSSSDGMGGSGGSGAVPAGQVPAGRCGAAGLTGGDVRAPTACSDGRRAVGITATAPTAPTPTTPATGSGVSLSCATRWHIAGLASWLVAHLCSQPAGQLQLVQEGVVQNLIRLVRHGRMAWTEASAERAALQSQRRGSPTAAVAAAAVPGPNSAGHTGGCGDEAAPPRPKGAATGGGSGTGSSSGGGGGRLMPHATSTSLYDATVAAAAAASSADSSPRVSAMPYMIAAVQYGMMALVNITFDNSVNQRVVAVAGMLSELETLFGMLLQPGVLLPRPAAATAAATGRSAAQTEGSTEAGELGGGGGGTTTEMGMRAEVEAAPHRDTDAADVAVEVEVEVLLRRGFLGVAQFAVWLLAHLSSSDPNLKADITGPSFSFVTRLQDFLMLPDVDLPQHRPQSAAAAAAAAASGDLAQGPPAPPPASAPAPPPAPPSAVDPFRTGSALGGGTGSRTAAAGPGVIVVRQYAAMALVNLTCGVPSTKATVARAMDWDGMAALLWWLADEMTGWLVATAAAAAAGDDCSRQQPPPSSPVSDLLLYTVWLLQHLSLSPSAAAATDPRVIAPLVVLLDAPEAHVRLRASAAIGALCSSPTPAAAPPGAAAAPAGAASAAAPRQQPSSSSSPPSSQQQQTSSQQQLQLQQPHRAAFLAADGVQRLLAMARRERDPHLLAYALMCLSSGVGDGDLVAVAEVVAGGALRLLEGLLASEFSGCLLPASEVLQALARAALIGLRRHHTRRSHRTGGAATAIGGESGDGNAAAATRQAAAAAAVQAAADFVPRSLLSRVVAVMLTHADPRVRSGMNEALGALTALPGVRDRYCTVFAETLRDLVSSAEVELQVIPVN